MKKYAIILAAGKGTRMLSDDPKCSIPFCSKPMISYIVDACKECSFDDIIVVVGHKKERIIEILGDSVKYVVQKEQLGTGHAVLCTEGAFNKDDSISIVLPGDMPLVDSKVIQNTIDFNERTNASLTVVSTIQNNPTGYGRIYFENGSFKKIIEEKDATLEQKKIVEVNTGLYCVNTNDMYNALHNINSSNKSNEYYFTDIVEVLGANKKVNVLNFEDSLQFVGINDFDALHKAEKLYISRKGL